VIAQIRRYKDALKRTSRLPFMKQAELLASSAGARMRRASFTRAGKHRGEQIYQMISTTRRQIIHLLPGFLARPLAFRQVKRAGEKFLGASVRRVGASIVVGVKESVTFETAPKGVGCLYYEVRAPRVAQVARQRWRDDRSRPLPREGRGHL